MNKNWQEEVWRIKKEISEETKNMPMEKYLSYIKKLAADFLKDISKSKQKLQKT